MKSQNCLISLLFISYCCFLPLLLSSQPSFPDSAVFWFESSSIELGNDEPIDQWESSAGDFSAVGAGSVFPSFTSNLIGENGGVTYDTQGYFVYSGESDLLSNSNTLIFFFRPQAQTYSLFAKGRAQSGDSQNSDLTLVPQTNTFRIRWNENGTTRSINVPNFAQNSFVFLRLEINREEGIASLYRNEELLASTECSTLYTDGNTSRPIYIGSYLSAPTFTFSGDIFDIALFRGNATSGDWLERLLLYMGSKYTAQVDLGPDILLDFDSTCDISLNALNAAYSSYLWSTGETTSSIEVNEPGKYSVVAKDDFGFLTTDTINITYGANTILSEYTLCDYDSLEWDLGLASEFSFEWSDGLVTNDPIRFLAPGTSYFVDVIGQNCMERTPTVTLLSDTFSQNTFLPADDDYCIGNMLSLINDQTEVSDIIWSTGEIEPSIVPQETGEYWVLITNENACIGSDTTFVNIIGTAPSVHISHEFGCEGDPIIINDLTDPEGATIINWAWQIGGDNFNESQVEYIFPNSGTFEVGLTVILDNGCSGSGTLNIDVRAKPVVNFTAPVVCAGTETFFEDLSTVPGGGIIAQQVWTFGNGTDDAGVVGSTTFAVQGMSTVTLEVESSEGCTNILVRNVEVLGSPVADFNADDVCIGTPMVFNENVDVSQSGPVFYNWQFGNGFFSNFPNTSHLYTQAGEYTVTLTATGNNGGLPGCVDSQTRSVRVFAAPSAALAVEDACVGEATTFTDLTVPSVLGGVADGVVSRTWRVNGDLIDVSGGATALWPLDASGVYQVTLNIETEAECSASAAGSFEALEIPEAAFGLDIPELAPPVEVMPVNNSTDAEGFVWLVDGTLVSTEASPSLSFSEAGEFLIQLAATNSLGCNDTASFLAKVIVPEYDLAILGIESSEANGRLQLSAVLSNLGNVPVRNFNLHLEIGQDVNFDTQVEHLIAPGTTVSYDLNADFFLIPGRTLPFTCIEVGNPNGIGELVPEVVELDLENNRMCTALDRARPTFAPPYPNPSGDVFRLGVVLPEGGRLVVRMIDAAGRAVRDGSYTLEAGVHHLEWPVHDVMVGVYLLEYEFEGEKELKRVVIAR